MVAMLIFSNHSSLSEVEGRGIEVTGVAKPC